MKLLNKRIVSAATSVAGVVSMLSAAPVAAQINDGITATEGSAGATGTDLDATINNAINILLWIVGAAAVVMLIVGGIRYITSQGDQAAVASAKNTILYAVIGIIVAMLAYAIVNFVFTTINNG